MTYLDVYATVMRLLLYVFTIYAAFRPPRKLQLPLSFLVYASMNRHDLLANFLIFSSGIVYSMTGTLRLRLVRDRCSLRHISLHYQCW
ncbi:hypothetical protein V1517DRAFT_331841 [Lipomyces orientalis]|uniref:Uncharacterized protein n=1 Tax=Lipomyces orientalis TaxID=1233043 RepID=A0ACC3TFI7_9ASCO